MDQPGLPGQGKLYAPQVRPNLVRRARLSMLIDSQVKLVVVAAPPGFGKTTLLATLTRRDSNTAWFSLDERDNDPSRFWLNLTQSLATIEPGIGRVAAEMFGSTDSKFLSDGALALSNEMAGAKKNGLCRLVLDDYHVIDNPTVHETLNLLIDNLPVGWQILMTTRSAPPLRLSLLRARAQVCEIGADELRFSPDETHQFFKQTAKIALSESAIAQINDRADGWAAALQLLAISLRNVKDHDGFIREFAGDSRLIADYFNAEVMARQSETIQRFLVVSSIPDRYCVALVQSLMDELPTLQQEDAYELVEYLEQSNLFLMPQDQKRQWFRYHNLFHELLRDRAMRDLRKELPALQRKAADWLEDNEYYEDALQMMLRMNDYPGGMRVIWSAARKYFFEGRFFKLREWLRLLPPETVGQNPRMVFLASLIAFTSGQPRKARKWLGMLLRMATDQHGKISDDPTLEAELQGFSLFARAWIETDRKNSGAAREIEPQIAQIIRQLSNPSPGTVARLKLVHGELLFQSGEIVNARKTLGEGIAACREWGYGGFAGSLYTRLAATYRLTGELRRMNQVAEEGIWYIETTRAAGRLEAMGYLQQMIAEARMERYQLEDARTNLEDLLLRSQRIRHHMLRVISGLTLTTVLRCQGELKQAIAVSEETFKIATHHGIKTWYLNGPGPSHLRMLLEKGDMDRAAEWVGTRELITEERYDNLGEYEYLAHCRLAIAQNNYDAVIKSLELIRSKSAAAGRLRGTLEALILSSIALRAVKKNDEASERLFEALEIARPQNYIRMFLDEGPALIRQLQEVPESSKHHRFASKILALAPTRKDHIRRMTLLGPDVLSKREIEVLKLISQGLSNRDVAEKLFLSPHTIKVHTRNIYNKLAVSSRTQAVAKASSLGLIGRGNAADSGF